MVAAWGETRPSTLEIDDSPPPPPVPEPEGLPSMPYIAGLTPAFTQHFEYRWTEEVGPFSGADRAHVQGWIRPRAPQPVDEIGLVTILDAWPLPLLTMAKAPLPASSVNWQITLCRPLPAEGIAADRWWLTDSWTHTASGGYADLEMRLWDQGGQLVALSRQLVVEFSGG